MKHVGQFTLGDGDGIPKSLQLLGKARLNPILFKLALFVARMIGEAQWKIV